LKTSPAQYCYQTKKKPEGQSHKSQRTAWGWARDPQYYRTKGRATDLETQRENRMKLPECVSWNLSFRVVRPWLRAVLLFQNFLELCYNCGSTVGWSHSST
jgi:hypothetical protein